MDSVLTFWVCLGGSILILILGFAATAYRLGLRDGLLWGRSPFPEATQSMSLHDSLWEVRMDGFDASGKRPAGSGAIVRLRQFDVRLVGEPVPESDARWSCEAVTDGQSLHLLTATWTPKGKRFASAQLEWQPDGSFTGLEIGRDGSARGTFVRPFALIPYGTTSAALSADEKLPNVTGRFENRTSPEPALPPERAISRES